MTKEEFDSTRWSKSSVVKVKGRSRKFQVLQVDFIHGVVKISDHGDILKRFQHFIYKLKTGGFEKAMEIKWVRYQDIKEVF